jgi:hypothetical protein
MGWPNGTSFPRAGLVWAAKNKSAVVTLPKRGRSLAISPDGALAMVIDDDVELWSLGEKPAVLRRWHLPGISSAGNISSKRPQYLSNLSRSSF